MSNRSRSAVSILWVAVASATALPQPAGAQSLGAFTWRLQPYCNRIVVNVTQTGSVYTLDGYDDQCGAAQRAPVVGVATPNPDNSIGFGLTVVNTPGGQSTHIDARINASAGFDGTWSDSAGLTGTIIFNGAPSGTRRPTARTVVTSLQASNIDARSIQAVALASGTGGYSFRSGAVAGVSNLGAGIAGTGLGTMPGVVGQSGDGIGVEATSGNGVAVQARSFNGVALEAEAISGTLAIDIKNGGIRVGGTVRPAFQHTTATSNVTAPNGTRIDHPLTNGDPNAMLFLTHAYVSGAAVFWTHPMGVFYNTVTSRWEIYAENGTTLPMNLRFNVLVFKQ